MHVKEVLDRKGDKEKTTERNGGIEVSGFPLQHRCELVRVEIVDHQTPAAVAEREPGEDQRRHLNDDGHDPLRGDIEFDDEIVDAEVSITPIRQGGAENNPPSFYTSRHYEVAKHYSLDEHTRIPDLVIFSQPIWKNLTAQERTWIEQAAAESVEFQRKLWIEKTAEALDAVEKAGVTIYRPDKQPFIDATAPMLEELKGTRIGDLARQIREVK